MGEVSTQTNPKPHRLEALRQVDPKVNEKPAENWNSNVLYYSNTPAETNGLFFSSSLGFLEVGMEHNTQLVRALSNEGNYWAALSHMRKTGYDNGHVRVAAPSFFAGSRLITDGLSGVTTKLIGGSEKVYPMGPESLNPSDEEYEKTRLLFDRASLQSKGAKVLQINLVTGYENRQQKSAFKDDAEQLALAARKVFGTDIFSSETYDPAEHEDRSLGAFAEYLYKKTDNLPAGSIVILEVFTHGNKSPFMHVEEDGTGFRSAWAGVLSWAAETPLMQRAGLPGEVNEWEFRQLINSLSQHLTILVRGNQCMGGQFCEGELVLPKHLAPANTR
jgi:hypothetical protein